MTGFWDNETPRTTNLPNPLVELPQELLDDHLGKLSNFVGLMDTPERVQAHLDAVQQYQTVKASLLPPQETPPTVANERGMVQPSPLTYNDQLEQARAAWKAAVDKRKRVLEELNAEVRELHAAFTAIKNS